MNQRAVELKSIVICRAPFRPHEPDRQVSRKRNFYAAICVPFTAEIA
jgi:hypothetical protein